MRSQNAEEVLKLRENPHFASVLASISCLITTVKTDHVEEVLKIIEMVDEVSVTNKYLILILSELDSTAFQNITINFKVTIHHSEQGTNEMCRLHVGESKIRGAI